MPTAQDVRNGRIQVNLIAHCPICGTAQCNQTIPHDAPPGRQRETVGRRALAAARQALPAVAGRGRL
jgi:hypothetical protein